MQGSTLTIDQQLQASNAGLAKLRSGLLAVFPKDLVLPEGPEAFCDLVVSHFTALHSTNAQNFNRVNALEGELKTLKAADQGAQILALNGELTTAKGRVTALEGEVTTLKAAEQDLDKRANAKFQTFASALGLDPSKAPKAGTANPAVGNFRAQYDALLAQGKSEEAGKLWAAHSKEIISGQ